METDWEQSWEREDHGQGRGFTPVQVFLLVLAILLAAALVGMGIFYFIL